MQAYSSPSEASFKGCAPDAQSPIAKELPAFARVAITYVMERFADEITLDDLACAARLSKFNFCRRFQTVCGVSPMKWVWLFRTMLAAEFIRIDPSWPVTDIAFACGFTSSAHFSRSFRKVFSTSAKQFKRALVEETSTIQTQTSSAYDLIYVTNDEAVSQALSESLGLSLSVK